MHSVKELASNPQTDRNLKAESNTYNDGTTAGLTIDVLEAQVEDQSSSAVQEAKNTNTYKELCRGGEVPLKVGHIGLTAVTERNVVRVRWQSDGKRTKTDFLRLLLWSGLLDNR